MDENKDKLNWNTIPTELQSYFAPRFIEGILITVIFTILIIVGSNKEIWGLGIVVGVLYFAYAYYIYYQVITKKVLVYEGECESVKIRAKEFNRISRFTQKKVNMLTVFGNSYIVLKILDKKFIVPVGANFVCEEGNYVRVYTLDSDIYEKGENAFIINNPILVYITKI